MKSVILASIEPISVVLDDETGCLTLTPIIVLTSETFSG